MTKRVDEIEMRARKCVFLRERKEWFFPYASVVSVGPFSIREDRVLFRFSTLFIRTMTWRDSRCPKKYSPILDESESSRTFVRSLVWKKFMVLWIEFNGNLRARFPILANQFAFCIASSNTAPVSGTRYSLVHNTTVLPPPFFSSHVKFQILTPHATCIASNTGAR